MDELKFGKRNIRGDWSPSMPIEVSPLFSSPLNFTALLNWLPHYFLPWNLLFGFSAVFYWSFLVPSLSTLKTVTFAWPLWLYLVNCVSVFIFYSIFEFRLYFLRRQGSRFKYNAKFPSDQPNRAFWFRSQNAEGMLRTFLSGIPIWTTYEVGLLWAYANDFGHWISFSSHPLYLFSLSLIMPFYREIHFYFTHRLIHWGPIYRWIHSVHHRSVNPSPWSSLSMHTVEHLIYFSSSLLHICIPSSPILVIFQLNDAGFGAIVGHIGFDKIEIGDEAALDSQSYAHYLHHKYFEVNYGDGLVPLDKLFGTWHDGTAAADAIMKDRFKRRNHRKKLTTDSL